MLSFELKGEVQQSEHFMASLKLPVSAPSLGGVEAIVTRPATTSHAGMNPEERQAMGISDNLIRLSVGLEATEDMIQDIEQALN
jgi:cystathionine beta-lyase/cystathionine gamma-synthase